MAKNRFAKPFHNYSVEGGAPKYMMGLANIVDTKVVLARKLHKEGKTCGEMAGQLGYSSAHGCAMFIKSLGLKPNVLPPTKKHYTEEEKRLRSERMTQYWSENPTHQNFWRKNMEVTVTYPKWHEEAREMRAKGMSLIEIAKKFQVTASRVSQVTNARWEVYMARDAGRVKHVGKEEKRKDDEAMAERMFEKFHSKNPQEKRNGVIVRCSHVGCNTTDLFMKAGAISSVHASKVFRNRGWSIGGGMKTDTCPVHAGNSKPAPVVQKNPNIGPASGASDWARANGAFKSGTVLSGGLVKNVLTDAPPIANKADQIQAEQKADVMQKLVGGASEQPVVHGIPQETAPVKSSDTMTPMTKADRRLIFAKLNEVYEDDGSAYKGDWLDDKVAADMGCPVLWVQEVREADFGPNTNAVSAKAAMTAQQVEEVKKLADLVVKAKADVEEALENAAAKTEIFDAKVAAFEAAHASLHYGDAPWFKHSNPDGPTAA